MADKTVDLRGCVPHGGDDFLTDLVGAGRLDLKIDLQARIGLELGLYGRLDGLILRTDCAVVFAEHDHRVGIALPAAGKQASRAERKHRRKQYAEQLSFHNFLLSRKFLTLKMSNFLKLISGMKCPKSL